MGGGGRSPCCDKNKVKKGPWSPVEDVRLVSFIQKHGHHNWRSLPKQAGLLRCGKSCRLRWINYLRPDLKRGNFTPQEEDSIIRLHATFGNKWSKIASKLPGRTDNEIKNVWNTHLKKRSKTLAANCNISNDHGNNQEISSIHQDVQKVIEGGEGGGGGGDALVVEDIAQPSTPSSTVSWNMFEDIQLIQPQIDQNHDHDHVPTESIDVDYYWMRLLEEELGLVDATSTTNQQIDHQRNDLTKFDEEQASYNTEMWCKISDEIYSLL